MDSITDEFRFYPLPDDVGHHNVIQLNPEGADGRREKERVFGIASQGYPSDRQHQLDSLPRGAKIGATIRRSSPNEPAVIDGEIEHLADETVYLDYCVSSVSPAQLQPMIAELSEETDSFAQVFAESAQPTGPGILAEVYPTVGSRAGLWLDMLIGMHPLEGRFQSLPRVGEPARDVVVHLLRSDPAYAVYYFSEASSADMNHYREVTATPRGSTRDFDEVFRYVEAMSDSDGDATGRDNWLR